MRPLSESLDSYLATMNTAWLRESKVQKACTNWKPSYEVVFGEATNEKWTRLTVQIAEQDPARDGVEVEGKV